MVLTRGRPGKMYDAARRFACQFIDDLADDVGATDIVIHDPGRSVSHRELLFQLPENTRSDEWPAEFSFPTCTARNSNEHRKAIRWLGHSLLFFPINCNAVRRFTGCIRSNLAAFSLSGAGLFDQLNI
jgi:hypothetical protein